MIVVSAIEVGDPPLRQGVLVSSIEESVQVLSGFTEDVLLVCSADELSRSARIARAALDQPNVGLIRVDGSPTQRAAAVRFLEALSPESYGLAQCLAYTVRAACLTRVALNSVSGLSAARPSVWQHLRSFFPKAQFEVDLSSGTVTSKKEIVWQPPRGALLCSAGSVSVNGLRLNVQGAAPGLVLPPTTTRVYGAKEWFELTVIEQADRIVTHVLGSSSMGRCRGCTRVVEPPLCPFCGSVSGVPQPATVRGVLR